ATRSRRHARGWPSGSRIGSTRSCGASSSGSPRRAPRGRRGPRRAGNGLVALVLAARLQVSLPTLLGATPLGLVEFVLARFRAQLLERWPTEVVDAGLGTGADDPVALPARGGALGPG